METRLCVDCQVRRTLFIRCDVCAEKRMAEIKLRKEKIELLEQEFSALLLKAQSFPYPSQERTDALMEAQRISERINGLEFGDLSKKEREMLERGETEE